MVHEHPLGRLILSEGSTVSVYGWFADSVDRDATFWVANAWQPHLFRPFVGADVQVRLADSAAVPDTTAVEVIGTWRDGSIIDAVVTKVDHLVTYLHESPNGTVSPVEFGTDNAAVLFQRLMESGTAPIIASGGMVGGIWLHVLYATAGFVRVHSKGPLKTDVWVSIVPIEARDTHRATW